MNKTNTAPEVYVGLLAVIVICLGLFVGYWHQAKEQSAFYKREGMDITPWECLWGIKPAEKMFRNAPK